MFIQERRYAPLLCFADGDAEYRRPLQTSGIPSIRISGEISDEVEVAVHGVLPHLFGDLFVVEEAASLLQAVVAVFPPSSAEQDDCGALEQTVEIDHQVVGTAPDLLEKC